MKSNAKNTGSSTKTEPTDVFLLPFSTLLLSTSVLPNLCLPRLLCWFHELRQLFLCFEVAIDDLEPSFAVVVVEFLDRIVHFYTIDCINYFEVWYDDSQQHNYPWRISNSKNFFSNSLKLYYEMWSKSFKERVFSLSRLSNHDSEFFLCFEFVSFSWVFSE